ncbi:MAG: hypothetical protein HY747_05635 [Elusimicrobia bacterium]|nr:hypothetical protein [Elusimicrobiota bacterium]
MEQGRLKTRLATIACLLAFYEIAMVGWLWLGNPPAWFRLFFYNLIWWPHLALVETSVELLWGGALLYRNFKGFIFLCLASTPFWTAYEIVNAGIGNWHYLNLPENPAVRWIGYAVSYASVLPAIRVYLELLRPKISHQPSTLYPLPSTLFRLGLFIAIAQFALCLAFPDLFYPLAWSFAFFIIEPLIVRILPGRSYLAEWLRGRWDLTVKTLIAGLMAGVTWEFFNWKAASKWVYTIPADVVLFKIFEMPVLGFIGFSAFALCAEPFSNMILTKGSLPKPWMRRTACLAGVAVSLAGFHLIDVYSWVK